MNVPREEMLAGTPAASAVGPRSVRAYWWGLQGRTTLNWNWAEINNGSVVFVTASEYSPDQSSPKASARFIGDAVITVENVSPHGPPYDPNNGVSFVVNVDWSGPVHIVTDITVFDPPVAIDVQPA